MKKNGANDGDRTRDNLDHNQGLYQLSYVRHRKRLPKGLIYSLIPCPVKFSCMAG